MQLNATGLVLWGGTHMETYSITNVKPTHRPSGGSLTVRLLGFIFVCLGALKLQGILFPEGAVMEYLGLTNPIVFFLSNRTVLSLAAIVEVIIGIVAVRGQRPVSIRAGMLLWLALATLAYKTGLTLVHYHGPCGCLLGINRFLPLRAGTQRWVADFIILFTIIAASWVLIYEHWFGTPENSSRNQHAVAGSCRS